MVNIFDQFDDGSETAQRSNVFDQFDDKDLSASEAAGDVFRQFSQGFNQKLHSLATAPDRVGRALTEPLFTNVLDPAFEAITGVKANTDPLPQTALGKFLSKDTPAQTKAGRIAKTAGGVVGLDLPLMAATLGSAGPIAKLTEGSVKLAPRVLNSLARSIQASPGRAATGEALASIGAGTGVGIAKEAGGGNVAQAAAGLAGGFTPLALGFTGPALVNKAVKAVRGRLSPAAQKASAEREAGAVLRRELGTTDPAESLARQAELNEVDELAPDLKLSLAERTQNPRLIELQRQVGQDLDPEGVAKEATRVADNIRTLEQAKTDLAPQSSFDPDKIVGLSQKNLEGKKDVLSSIDSRLDSAEQDLIGTLGSRKVNLRSQGEALRQAISQRRSGVKREMSQLANDLGLNDQAAALNIGQLKDDLIQSFRSSSKLRIKDDSGLDLTQDSSKLARSFGGDHPLVKEIGNLEDNQSIDALTQLRSLIGEELEIALRNATPGNAAQRVGLTAMQRRLDSFIDNIGVNQADELGQKYQQFRQAYRTEYADKFERGAAYKVRQKGSRREYKTRDEEVAKTFWKPGDEQAALQFKAIFGNDQVANESLKNVALDSLFNSAFAQGRINQTSLNGWKNKHKTLLDLFPDIKKSVDDIDSTILSLGQRRADNLSRQREIEQSLLGRELASFTRGTRTSEQVIERAIQDPRRMRELARNIKTEEGLNGLRRSVWENVFSQQKPREFLTENAQSLRSVLGQKKFDQARVLLTAINKATAVQVPRGSDVSALPSVDNLEQFLNTGLNQISSRIFAVQSGRTSARFVGFDLLGRFARGYSKRQAQNILMEAMLDPDVAKRLTDGLRNSKNAESLKRLYTYLFAVGLGADGKEENAPLEEN